MKLGRCAQFHGQRPVTAGLAGSVLLLLLAGCNGEPVKPDNIPDLTPCAIKVIYQGQPVPGATVTLAPKSGQFSAAGNTDASGRAIMKTNAMYTGVVPGEFLVSITKLEMPVTTDAEEPPLDPVEYAKLAERVPPPPKHLIPEKYSSFRTSGLTLTVNADTLMEKTFELTDDKKG